MILPATHKTSLMGSGSSLLRDWQQAFATMLVLDLQLRECRPHMRDYEPETYRSSLNQHIELEKALANLRNYAYTMINHLDR